jgi:hypothetical protein
MAAALVLPMAFLTPARNRPASVTILTMLHVIIGIVDIMVGFLLFLAYQQPGSFVASFIGVPVAYSFFLVPIAVAYFTFGILAFILTYGIWKGLGWAWHLSLILATAALVVGGFSVLIGALASALSIAIYALIIIFLSLSSVRMFCGRSYFPRGFIVSPVPGTWSAAPLPSVAPAYGRPAYGPALQQPYYPGSQPPSQQLVGWGAGACPSCGSPLQNGATFCAMCGMRFR